jgi:diguanylate cyclase (GGDEF)-like protein
MATTGLACKVAVASAAWPVIALVPISWSLFMWHFCFNVPSRRYMAEAAVVALIVLLVSAAALTNPLHGLLYGPETALIPGQGRPSVRFDHGPLFYAIAGFLYLFLAAGFTLSVVAAFRASRTLRPMMFMLMFATAVPMASNVGYVVLDASLFGFDPTPFAFSFVLLALTWAIFANRGLDLVTLARDLLFFNLRDPVLVVNARGVVVGSNAAARAWMPQFARVGPLSEDPSLDLIRTVIGCTRADPAQEEVSLGDRTFNMRVLPIARPVQEDGGHLGAVAVLSDVTQLKIRNDQLAEALDRSRAQVAEISRLREIAERSAMSDPLTGAGNRRALEARVGELGDVPLALALIDLDHFKQINDGLGHAVGDRVLKDFAQTARVIMPAEAEIYRVGGEEFVMLLVGGALSDLLAILCNLREALARRLSLRDLDGVRVTYSAGVATRPRDGDTLEELLARADTRLYLAKRNGRDKVMHLDSVPASTRGPFGPLDKAGGAGGD